MIYLYSCAEHGCIEVIKSASRIDEVELCDDCQKPMERKFNFQGQLMKPGGFKEEFHPAFGKVISTRHQLNNELKKIKGETGKELVEIGNDGLNGVKPSRKRVNKEEVARELKYRIKHGGTTTVRDTTERA